MKKDGDSDIHTNMCARKRHYGRFDKMGFPLDDFRDVTHDITPGLILSDLSTPVFEPSIPNGFVVLRSTEEIPVTTEERKNEDREERCDRCDTVTCVCAKNDRIGEDMSKYNILFEKTRTPDVSGWPRHSKDKQWPAVPRAFCYTGVRKVSPGVYVRHVGTRYIEDPNAPHECMIECISVMYQLTPCDVESAKKCGLAHDIYLYNTRAPRVIYRGSKHRFVVSHNTALEPYKRNSCVVLTVDQLYILCSFINNATRVYEARRKSDASILEHHNARGARHLFSPTKDPVYTNSKRVPDYVVVCIPKESHIAPGTETDTTTKTNRTKERGVLGNTKLLLYRFQAGSFNKVTPPKLTPLSFWIDKAK